MVIHLFNLRKNIIFRFMSVFDDVHVYWFVVITIELKDKSEKDE